MKNKNTNYEELLVQQAYKSAKNIAGAKKRKYAEIKQAVVDECETSLNKEAEASEKVRDDDWSIGFTPSNLTKLIKLSGAKSNTAFYQKYNISKTVLYSYLRGKTSPTYKAWVSLVERVAEDNNTSDKNKLLLRRLVKTKLN